MRRKFMINGGVKLQFPLHLTVDETTEEAALLHEYLLNKIEFGSAYYFSEDEVITIHDEGRDIEFTLESAHLFSNTSSSFIIFKPYTYIGYNECIYYLEPNGALLVTCA